jgi:hypothetical protein
MAAVFLDIEEALDTTWHSGLQYKLSKFEFSTNLIKLISFFLSQGKFIASVEGEMSTPMEQGCLKVLSCPLLCTTGISIIPSKHLVFTEPSLQTTLACRRKIERRVLLSENSSAVSAQWRPSVSAGILK